MLSIIITDNVISNKTPSLYWSLAKPFNTSNGGQNDQLHVSIRPRRPLNAALLPFSNISYGGDAAVVRARRETRVAATAVTTATDIDESVSAKAVITVKPSVVGFLTDIGFDRLQDEMTDLCGKTLLLELVSAEADPKSGEKETIKAYAQLVKIENGTHSYEAHFKIPGDFGEVGAVVVENQHHRELYLANIVLDGLPFGPLRFPCYSWVHSKFDSSLKRIFFNDKSYLPSQTPSGLKQRRESELENLRGNGQGERQAYERIYDYDYYNDIGDPDSDPTLLRPVLGGNKDFPYPKRCRTGRPSSQKYPESESRSSSVYVPRDEQFSEIKTASFLAKTAYSILHGVVPGIDFINNPELSFPFFSDIDTLFYEGINLQARKNSQNILVQLLQSLIKGVDVLEAILRFEPPELLQRDRFSWFRDEEFSRQTLAGLNPCRIKLVTEWPLMSKLDPKTYGPPKSAITKELIEMAIGDLMTLEEAIKQKKLFMLDYHDALLPYVRKVRELKGTTLYGSRTLFFLSPDGSLKPLAIELTRPQIDEKPQWKQVFTPSSEATSFWLWRLAKAHVLAHDSGYHQLISHWLRTHCCTEPYIIAANRQLSAMHPIYRLLHPHFRYIMEINARARSSLINAGGIIEGSFSPHKYSMEMSSVIYDLEWRFDHQSLPADLISRGMAVEDSSSPHGLKLTIEDYPYANDGLILWDSIKQWVTDYVNHYYPESTLIKSDQELQAWWTEIRTIGHGDKKDEPWWPNLKSNQDLIEIITTIVWVSSGHHAAVNFGQYAYAGYFPNRPTIARIKMPTEDSNEEEMKHLLEKPEQVLLQCFPSQKQAISVMAVLDVLSNHSADEQYIGGKLEPSWEAEPAIKAAFEIFQGRIKELEGIIDQRNLDSNLKNRNGAGIVPYELLKPFSDRGVTNMGVPNSISI